MKRAAHMVSRGLGISALGFTLMSGEVAVGAESTPKASATAKAIEPPLGFWSDQKMKLYILVEAGKGDSNEAMSTERRRLQIGGPPPTKNKADDIFIPEKFERRGNAFVATGTFNWDAGTNPIEVEVAWTAQSVTVKIVKNPGYQMFSAGTYVLKRQKR